MGLGEIVVEAPADAYPRRPARADVTRSGGKTRARGTPLMTCPERLQGERSRLSPAARTISSAWEATPANS
jgi:hypothetical protein